VINPKLAHQRRMRPAHHLEVNPIEPRFLEPRPDERLRTLFVVKGVQFLAFMFNRDPISQA
jgi:hypothetical protein